VAQDVRLTAATVPPGGLLTSFLGNQVIYCSLICPLLIQTGVTPIVTTLQAPGTFLTALQSGDLLKAIGVAAASVTGPTNAAAEQAILVDSEIPAQRALNAFEVGVVGLLNIAPGAAGGLPGIVTAIQAFRQDTFTALNLPIMPNPMPTVMPHGVLQVAVVGGLNVVGAVIFPGFNHILSGAFETPDAIAQELAATGNPVRAVVAGVNTAAGEVTAAVTDIADSVVTAVGSIRAASGQSLLGNRGTQPQISATTTATTTTPTRAKVGPPHPLVATTTPSVTTTKTTTTPARAKVGPPRPAGTTTTKQANAGDTSRPLRDLASNLRQSVRSVIKKASERPHRTAST
jgi:hypothetical protein